MELVNACRAVVAPNECFSSECDKVSKRISVVKNKHEKPKVQKEEFSAEEFVENLLKEGVKIPCDETSETFNNNLKIPPFYNEELFKKGKQFFHENLFSLFLSKLLGLITLLTLPDSTKILVMTNQSSTQMTAYRRYLSTIFHMVLWYDEEFKPGSKSWMSITKVRNMHNSASKRSRACLKYGINQKDMALTQFGFIGYGLVRQKMVGVHHATEEELKGFIHLWRNVGYILGIEDRFNICRESISETKQICNLIIEKVFRPTFEKPSEIFDELSKMLIGGMWAMNPYLEHKLFIFYLKLVLENRTNIKKGELEKMTLGVKFKLYLIFFILWSLQFALARIYFNYNQKLTLWLMKIFPFLAYYMFGKRNSHVTV